MINKFIKTKIVATLGPATDSDSKIKELITAGANVFRLNFSHGSYKQHQSTLLKIRKASKELNKPVAILQDLAGPKIRITDIKNGFTDIAEKSTVFLRHSPGGELSNQTDIFVFSISPSKILKEGNKVLLSDGLIELFVNKVHPDRVECIVTKGGRLRSRAGISFPDSIIDLPAATEKDLQDIQWGVENGVDYVAVSFVQNAEDLRKLKEQIKGAEYHLPLIAKIERKAALENINEIAEEADGIMVARGDLGLELPLEKLPHIQQHLIQLGHHNGIPVIVATQMLHSMVKSNRPTRAEVTDIAAAVTAGADALMLSEETAIGEHPILAVEYLRKIAAEAENAFDHERHMQKLIKSDNTTVPEAVAVAAVAAAEKIQAAALVACTESGNTARLISKYRPRQTVFGVSASEVAIRRMCLYSGVMPVSFRPPKDHYDELATAIEAIKQRCNLPPRSLLVLTGGLSVRTPGSTSVMEIREI